MHNHGLDKHLAELVRTLLVRPDLVVPLDGPPRWLAIQRTEADGSASQLTCAAGGIGPWARAILAPGPPAFGDLIILEPVRRHPGSLAPGPANDNDSVAREQIVGARIDGLRPGPGDVHPEGRR